MTDQKIKVTDQKIKIFIASASEDETLVAHLQEQLKKYFIVNPWYSRFDYSKSLENSFRKELDSNDFFVFVCTPNAESVRISNNISKSVANDNLILEFGAAYGRYGIARTIIIQDPTVTLPSDLDGIHTIREDLQKDLDRSKFIRIADKINSHIKDTELETASKRLHWLSLMKTKPGAQRKFTEILNDFAEEAKSKWDVSLEKYGVVSGYYDNYLIFSVPTIENFVSFITELRRTYPSLKKVDSRLIFPNKYWTQTDPPPPNFNSHTIVFLECVPEYVEKIYEKILAAAQNESKRGIKGIDIITTGITTGDADLFFIVASESYDACNWFIENDFHNKILPEGWLIDNTTTRYILKEIKSEYM